MSLNGKERVESAAETLRREASVLSAPGQRFEATPELRDQLALLDNGELHVVRGQQLNHAVMAYQQDLRRHGLTPTLVPNDLEAVRAFYAQAEARRQGGIVAVNRDQVSRRQETVLKLIRSAVAQDASDLHFIMKSDVSLIRQRVHGVLEDVTKLPRDEVKALISCVYQSMCDVSSDPEFRQHQPQDARMKQTYLASAGLFGARYASRPSDDGLLMVLRLLYNRGTRARSLSELGYNEVQAESIRVMTRRKEGINIFSGATGSGKSTSLEVLMGMLIRHFEHRLHVLTLEDPPEYRIPGAVQTPVIDGEWAEGIRNMMRLDPDVIMIGEMRDGPSAQAAFRAAMTGHGVWTTLHANDAVAILQRLHDIGVDPGLMLDPSNVTGLINQSLVRRLCDGCKQPWRAARHLMDEDLVRRVERHCTPETVYVAGPGCPKCQHRTIVGRTVVAEVIVPNIAFMRRYQTDGKAQARAYWVREMGGITKTQHLIAKINAGQVDPRHGEENVGPLDTDAIVGASA